MTSYICTTEGLRANKPSMQPTTSSKPSVSALTFCLLPFCLFYWMFFFLLFCFVLLTGSWFCFRVWNGSGKVQRASCVIRAAHISKNSMVGCPPAAVSCVCEASAPDFISTENGMWVDGQRRQDALDGAILTRTLLVFFGIEGFEIQQVGFVIHLVELQRHLGVLLADGVLAAHLHVVRVHRLPFLPHKQ